MKVRPQTESATHLAEAFCIAQSLTRALPDRLASDASGQRFAVPQIHPSDDPVQLAGILADLGRIRPVGGYAHTVSANQRHMYEMVAQQLNARIAELDLIGAAVEFLGHLHRCLQRLKDELQSSLDDIEAEYAQVQAILKDWQDNQAESGGMLRKVFAWTFGSDRHLSLPEVSDNWNRREQLALDRYATTMAIELCSRLSELISSSLAARAAVARISRSCADQAAQDFQLQAQHDEVYQTWAWCSDPATLATRLAARADLTGLTAQILSDLSPEVEPALLRARAAELAQAESERLLTDLTTVQLIEAEAADGLPADELHPLLLVGRHLLEQIAAQPGWRLARTARPRVETLQVTADGSPLFRHEGLHTAAYGAAVDRFGFMQVEFDVAIEDLQLMCEGDERFAQAQAQRNFYVVDELAAAWEERQAAAAPQPAAEPEQAAAQSWNGAETASTEVAS